MEPRSVDATKWNESISEIQNRFDFDDEKAEKIALRAFGWGSQAFWQKEKVKEIPEPEDVRNNIRYLAGKGT